MVILTTPPPNWLMLNGQTIANADALYPALWALPATTTWRSGTSLVLPDLSDRVSMGASATGALGTLGGANARAIPLGALPAHNHTIAHTHEHPHTHTIAHTHTISHVHSIAHDHPGGTTSASIVPALNIPLVLMARFGSGNLGVSSVGGPAAPLNLIDQPNTDAGGSHTHPFNVAPFAGNSGAASPATSGGASTGSSGQPSDATTGGASPATSGTTGSGSTMDITQAHLRVNFMIRAI